MINRPVFFTDSSNVARSNGEIERGSITSALQPRCSSPETASKAT